MKLNQYEKDMAEGKYGPGLKKAINILIRYGDACGAKEFVEITSGHIMPEEPPELLEQLTEGVEKLPQTTTMHPLMSSFSPEKWEAMGIPKDFAAKKLSEHDAREKLHEKLGFLKTYSCLPMMMGNLPREGDYISWIGSCAQNLVNSVIGARTNRDGTMINLCSCLTGRTPKRGLLLPENRYAKVLVTLADGVTLQDDIDYGAFGYYIGAQVGNKSIAVEGLPKTITFNQLKYMMAPAAASGSIPMFHIIGVTPEATTREKAFGGKEPEMTIEVTRKNLEETKAIFAFDQESPLDLVLFGCPHLTIEEIGGVASYIKDKKLKKGKRLWMATGDSIYTLAQTMGYTDIIEAAGGVFSHTCMATIPDSPLPKDVKTVMTNSFKSAHYIRSLQKGKVKVMVGNVEQCLDMICEAKGANL